MSTDLLKREFQKLSDCWSGDFLTLANAHNLERGFKGADSEFFDSIYWMAPANSGVKVVAGFKARFEKIQTSDSRYSAILEALAPKVEQLRDLAVRIHESKTQDAAAKTQRAQQRAERALEKITPKRYQAATALGKLVREIADSFKSAIEASQALYLTSIVEEWDKRADECGSRDTYKCFIEPVRKGATPVQYAIAHRKRQICQRLSQGEIRENVATEARLYAERAVEKFAFKMEAKIGELVNGREAQFDARGYLGHNTISVRIGNDTSFLIQSQFVHKFSVNGTPFCQYPTTFHQVVINGVRLESPSEEKVKEAMKDQAIA